jgi:hypothetical protein
VLCDLQSGFRDLAEAPVVSRPPAASNPVRILEQVGDEGERLQTDETTPGSSRWLRWMAIGCSRRTGSEVGEPALARRQPERCAAHR